jgi:hypothetical protein
LELRAFVAGLIPVRAKRERRWGSTPERKGSSRQAAEINIAIGNALAEQALDKRCCVLLLGRKIECLNRLVHTMLSSMIIPATGR